MTPFEVVAILLAGCAAGTINTVVGSGTLITFPTLLAVGLSPVTANVSNNIGLAPGGLSGTWGYRRELEGTDPQQITGTAGYEPVVAQLLAQARHVDLHALA